MSLAGAGDLFCVVACPARGVPTGTAFCSQIAGEAIVTIGGEAARGLHVLRMLFENFDTLCITFASAS